MKSKTEGRITTSAVPVAEKVAKLTAKKEKTPPKPVPVSPQEKKEDAAPPKPKNKSPPLLTKTPSLSRLKSREEKTSSGGSKPSESGGSKNGAVVPPTATSILGTSPTTSPSKDAKPSQGKVGEQSRRASIGRSSSNLSVAGKDEKKESVRDQKKAALKGTLRTAAAVKKDKEAPKLPDVSFFPLLYICNGLAVMSSMKMKKININRNYFQ